MTPVYSDMRHPDKVEFTSDLDKDLARRDFTMNAMAMDLDGEITDIFGGMADIENGIIRCVGDPDRRFAEDALRMFRALRFSAQLGFEIEERTKNAVLKNARRASAVSAERIREELLKTINSPRPERAADMFASGLFGDIRGNMDLLCKMAGRLKYLPKSGQTRLIALAGALGEATDINAGSFLERLHCGRKTLELAGAFSYVPCDSAQEIKVSCGEYGAEKTMAACAVCDAVYGGKRYRILRGFLKSGLPHSAGELPIGGRELMELGVVPGKKWVRCLKDCTGMCVLIRKTRLLRGFLSLPGSTCSNRGRFCMYVSFTIYAAIRAVFQWRTPPDFYKCGLYLKFLRV